MTNDCEETFDMQEQSMDIDDISVDQNTYSSYFNPAIGLGIWRKEHT